MQFGPNDAVGVNKIGPAKGDFEVVIGGSRQLRVFQGGGIEIQAVTVTPGAPKLDAFTLYSSRDVTDGKVRLYVRFPSGVVQILATEP